MKQKLFAFAHGLGLDRLFFRLFRYSPRGLVRLYRHHAFDRRFGVETRGYSDLRYEPTPADVFHEMLSKLSRDPRELVFVDIGSGKGKVLMLAATYPFRRVVGVELFDDLNRIAERNLERFRAERACIADVTCVRQDAAEFRFPEEPLVVFFFNPFASEIIARVLDNLRLSLERARRPIYVLFYAPVRRGTPWDRRAVFEAAGFLRVLEDDPRYTIYGAS